MRILLWAEFQKLRRSHIVLLTVFSVILIAVFVFIGGKTLASSEQMTTNDAGWYMASTQVWATLFVLPAVTALLGSFMICREEQEDTMKSLRIIPVSETKLTAAKMIVTFLVSVLLYGFLFVLTLLTEAILHLSALSWEMVWDFGKMYVLDGIGVFLAVSPIIALVSYMKKSYWIALVIAELYSFAGLFMSMSNALRTYYPITAVFGAAGYYETTAAGRFGSAGVLLLCGLLAVVLLKGLNDEAEKHS